MEQGFGVKRTAKVSREYFLKPKDRQLHNALGTNRNNSDFEAVVNHSTRNQKSTSSSLPTELKPCVRGSDFSVASKTLQENRRDYANYCCDERSTAVKTAQHYSVELDSEL